MSNHTHTGHAMSTAVSSCVLLVLGFLVLLACSGSWCTWLVLVLSVVALLSLVELLVLLC
jgi:hypothetical protein